MKQWRRLPDIKVERGLSTGSVSRHQEAGGTHSLQTRILDPDIDYDRIRISHHIVLVARRSSSPPWRIRISTFTGSMNLWTT